MNSKPFLLAVGLLGALAQTGTSQPVITNPPQDQTNVLGTAANFSVAAIGTEPLNYQWWFGSPPANLEGATNALLVITNVQAANEGPYQVVITNVEGAVTSAVANLYVTPTATLQFAASSYTVAESAGSVSLSVQRSGATNLTVSVDYSTSDGTATNGMKYKAVSGPLSFGPGETNKTIVGPILNEGLVEGTKNFRVTLSNPSSGAVLGARFTATVAITDNDFGVQFQFATNSVAEDAGSVVLAVVRGDDGSLPVTVDVYTTDLTATNGLDYTGTSNTLTFGAQERIEFVFIPILNNLLKQPNRSFRVTLANPVGATLGSQRTATATIVDNDQGFQFDLASHTVAEDAGAARIGVLRGTDDTNSSVSVDFATADGSATNGVNYLATNGTLSFGPGERAKVFSVPILNNGVKEPKKNFRVTLSNPSGGAVLGSPTKTTVSILDNDPGVGFERTAFTNAWGEGSDFTVTILRGNDWSLGPITVDYTTANLTATAGQDYQAVSGTLEFQPNETVKTINIPILRNRAGPASKTFRVVLSNPTGGATLGTSSATVNILGSYVAVAPPFDTALNIVQEGGLSILSWSGGGQLQRADRPTGPWQILTNATNPYTVQSPVSSTFYRVTRPRPVNLYVPSGYDGRTLAPLVILLHNLSSTGAEIESYIQFQPLAEARGFLYCYPDSMIDRAGAPFWNATDSCCDFWNTGIDDAGYLRALIEEIGRRFSVDRKRVYLVGRSNGAFMAYRMACQSADVIAGIAALAGTTFLDPGRCQPCEPVNILHIHGTADEFVFYAGGALTTAQFPGNLPAFPGALRDIEMWAAYNGASGPVTDPMPSLDLTTDVPGLDTVVTRYANFPPGGAVELWTTIGGLHYPTLSTQFSALVIDWLLAHPKP